MDIRLKAALAAAAGTTVMLGGAGTLASWNDEETLPGTAVRDGELTMDALACGDWLLGATPYTTQLLAPGDTITRTCTTSLVVQGELLTGELAVAAPTWESGDAAFTGELVPTVAYTLGGSTYDDADAPVAVDATDDGAAVSMTVSVAWPYGSLDNDVNDADLTAVLDGVDLVLTQTP